MAVPKPWLVTNLSMYSTPLICPVIFNISEGVELAKLGPLAKFDAQLVGLVAWKVLKTHQGTHQVIHNRSHHSMIFQL